MNLLVNVDNNWGIGREGALLVVIKGDMKRFAQMTTNKVVIVGRETLKTFPGGKPLKNRTNIILTRNPDYVCEGAVIAHSLEELAEELKHHPSDEVFVIGGESVYRQLLPYVRNAYVTRFDRKDPADKYFPDLDRLPGWELLEQSDPVEEEGILYHYRHYVNNNPENL